LDNLLNNAKRFAKTTIIVRWTETQDHQQLTVEDDGTGIPTEQRTQIFEPFMRLDNSRTRATGGHGLGLAIVASIAKAHGGQARVTDSPLGGALFSMQWPKTNLPSL
jgi:two-component system sensor histidine kinase RstB